MKAMTEKCWAAGLASMCGMLKMGGEVETAYAVDADGTALTMECRGEANLIETGKKTSVGRKQAVRKKPKQTGEKARQANEKTRQAVNKDVERALLRKAVGYTYTQQESYKVKYIEYEEGTGKKKFERESVEVVEVTKYVPPEYSAIALWLKARMPQIWGDAAQEAAAEPVVIVDDIPAQMGAGDKTVMG